MVLQFCLAHLIRDVKYLTTLPDPRDRAYGEALRESLRDLFAVIHRREEWTEGEFRRRLEAARDRVLARDMGRAGDAGQRQPGGAFGGAWGEHFRFITEPGVGPTNNLAEQAIRFVVIDRLITQGTRSERGDRWCERIWTVMATCSQQGRSVFAYLEAAVTAWFAGEEARRCCRERADLRRGSGSAGPRDARPARAGESEGRSPPRDSITSDGQGCAVGIAERGL